MDLSRIALRIVFVWIVVLALLRVSGKRTVKQGESASFVVALIIGDMFDDMVWAEVPAAQFVVGTGTLMLLHLLVSVDMYKRGVRYWQQASGRAEPS